MNDTTERAVPLTNYGRAMWRGRWVILILVIVAVAAAITYCKVATPLYESTATILPPELTVFSGSELSGSRLLGTDFSSLLGGESPAAMVVLAMLKSPRMADDLLAKFSLKNRYEAKYRAEAIKELADRTRVVVTKENAVTVTVADESPEFAANMANFYIENLDAINADVKISASKPMVRLLGMAVPAERPSWPNTILTVGLAVVIAFGLGFFVSLWMERRHQARAGNA